MERKENGRMYPRPRRPLSCIRNTHLHNYKKKKNPRDPSYYKDTHGHDIITMRSVMLTIVIVANKRGIESMIFWDIQRGKIITKNNEVDNPNVGQHLGLWILHNVAVKPKHTSLDLSTQIQMMIDESMQQKPLGNHSLPWTLIMETVTWHLIFIIYIYDIFAKMISIQFKYN